MKNRFSSVLCQITYRWLCFSYLKRPLRWLETKKIENFDIDNFFMPLDGNITLYNCRTWEYIAKTEIEIFLTVIISMITVG